MTAYWGNETVFFAADGARSQALGLADGTIAIVGEINGNIFGFHLDEVGKGNDVDFMRGVSGRFDQAINTPQIVQNPNGGPVTVTFNLPFNANDTDIAWHELNPDFSPHAETGYLELDIRQEFLNDSTATLGGGMASVFTYVNADGSSNLAMRSYATDGAKLHARTTVGAHAGETQQNGVIASLVNGNVAVAYENFNASAGVREVRLHIYNRAGADVAGEITVGATGNAAFPDMAVTKDGSFVVAFHDIGSGIYFRRYNQDGSPIDGEANLIAGSANSLTPKVTALHNGGFIVAWVNISGREGDGSPEQEIFLQLFDGGGNAVGVPFEIDKPGDQILTSIATLDDDRVILTYRSETGDSTNEFTQNFRIVDPRGATIVGSSGNDNIVSREAGATIIGRAGDDRLTGRDGVDNLDGGDGNDTLIGGGGADTMTGGIGSDDYFVDQAGDRIIETASQGSLDRVITTVSYALAAGVEVEVLAVDTRGLDPINLTGNEFGQSLVGNAGNNILNGKGGADQMFGNRGNDLYYVDNAGDRAWEGVGEGFDRVLASVSYTLTAGEEIERLTTTDSAGTSAINLTGNEFAQLIQGNAGANTLDGRGGADTMQGYGGNDTYIVDNPLDRIVEVAGGGNDRVIATTAYKLTAGAEVERLAAANSDGTTAMNLIGNEFGQSIQGNAGRNNIYGGAGNDTLTGGRGRDVLFGEAGNDIFDFNAVTETGNDANTRDVIRDFTRGQDRIDLSTIDANGAAAGDAFSFRGTAAFSGVAGQLRYVQIDAAGTAQDITVVAGDVNGDGLADFQIGLTGLINLVAGDFLL